MAQDQIPQSTDVFGGTGSEVSDIFRKHLHLLEALPSDQVKVVRDLMNCRTSALGGHKLKCGDCDHEVYAYNSCRNRHCPKCQFLAQKRWVEERSQELLPVEYFHVVFTLPHELNPIIWCNKKIAYQILFRAMSETLLEVAERRLKAKIGFTAVLHTWGQTLTDHAHIHAIVPGGGLSFDQDKWIHSPQGYLLPLKIMSEVFRGKFLDYFEKSYSQLKLVGRSEIYNHPRKFKSLLRDTAKKKWMVYAKKPFAGPKQVLEYLGNYTHRIAISNHRIVKVENGSVTFRYQDRANNNEKKTMTLEVSEFMRRFLLHTLPEKFVRIRHFGFLGARNKKSKIERIRKLLNAKQIDRIEDVDWKASIKRLTGHDVDRCPKCKHGVLIEVDVILPHPKLRSKKWRDSS